MAKNPVWVESEEDRELYEKERQEITDAYGGVGQKSGIATLGFGRMHPAKKRHAKRTESRIKKRWKARTDQKLKEHREARKSRSWSLEKKVKYVEESFSVSRLDQKQRKRVVKLARNIFRDYPNLAAVGAAPKFVEMVQNPQTSEATTRSSSKTSVSSSGYNNGPSSQAQTSSPKNSNSEPSSSRSITTWEIRNARQLIFSTDGLSSKQQKFAYRLCKRLLKKRDEPAEKIAELAIKQAQEKIE